MCQYVEKKSTKWHFLGEIECKIENMIVTDEMRKLGPKETKGTFSIVQILLRYVFILKDS